MSKKSIYHSMSKERYLKLCDVLGLDNNRLNTIDISVNTDRRDASLASSIGRVYRQLDTISDILFMEVDDFEFKIDWDYSDHEMISHTLDLNPKREEGATVLYEDIRYIITDVSNGIVTMKSNNGVELKLGENYVTDVLSWEQVFFEK